MISPFSGNPPIFQGLLSHQKHSSISLFTSQQPESSIVQALSKNIHVINGYNETVGKILPKLSSANNDEFKTLHVFSEWKDINPSALASFSESLAMVTVNHKKYFTKTDHWDDMIVNDLDKCCQQMEIIFKLLSDVQHFKEEMNGNRTAQLMSATLIMRLSLQNLYRHWLVKFVQMAPSEKNIMELHDKSPILQTLRPIMQSASRSHIGLPIDKLLFGGVITKESFENIVSSGSRSISSFLHEWSVLYMKYQELKLEMDKLNKESNVLKREQCEWKSAIEAMSEKGKEWETKYTQLNVVHQKQSAEWNQQKHAYTAMEEQIKQFIVKEETLVKARQELEQQQKEMQQRLKEIGNALHAEEDKNKALTDNSIVLTKQIEMLSEKLTSEMNASSVQTSVAVESTNVGTGKESNHAIIAIRLQSMIQKLQEADAKILKYERMLAEKKGKQGRHH